MLVRLVSVDNRVVKYKSLFNLRSTIHIDKINQSILYSYLVNQINDN